MRKEKGITLIALIITIIVMLILVGVTVSVALNGGLFSTAKEAASKTQYEADYETLQAGVIGALNRDLVILDEEALKKNLPGNWNVVKEGTIYKVTSPNGNEYKVNENGEILDESENPTQEWWEFQGTEPEEVESTYDNIMGYKIAVSPSGKGIYRVKHDSANLDYLYMGDGSSVYVYILNENTLQALNKSGVEMKKWYKASDATLSNPTEYRGNCPISVSDFADSDIYSRSYLERIIANFNK